MFAWKLLRPLNDLVGAQLWVHQIVDAPDGHSLLFKLTNLSTKSKQFVIWQWLIIFLQWCMSSMSIRHCCCLKIRIPSDIAQYPKSLARKKVFSFSAIRMKSRFGSKWSGLFLRSYWAKFGGLEIVIRTLQTFNLMNDGLELCAWYLKKNALRMHAVGLFGSTNFWQMNF